MFGDSLLGAWGGFEGCFWMVFGCCFLCFVFISNFGGRKCLGFVFLDWSKADKIE